MLNARAWLVASIVLVSFASVCPQTRAATADIDFMTVDHSTVFGQTVDTVQAYYQATWSTYGLKGSLAFEHSTSGGGWALISSSSFYSSTSGNFSASRPHPGSGSYSLFINVYNPSTNVVFASDSEEMGCPS
jgi:hypothetical protein